MSRRPSRPAALALVAAAVAGGAILPATASADVFGGGYAQVIKNKRADDLGSAANVSADLQGAAVRVTVIATTRRCTTGGLQRLSGVVPDPGTSQTFTATRTVRLKIGRTRGRVRIAIEGRRTAPDAFSGTVALIGTIRAGKAKSRCRATLPIELRSTTPAARPGTAFGLSRYGTTSERLDGQRAGALLVSRPDGRLGATWTTRFRCRSAGRPNGGGIATTVAPPFRVRPDGSFRGVERHFERGGKGRTRYSFSFKSTISGRIGPDGVARGTVRASSRYERFHYYPNVCRTKTASFVAAP